MGRGWVADGSRAVAAVSRVGRDGSRMGRGLSRRRRLPRHPPGGGVGHKDRATIKARNSWMEDLSKGGKLTPRALGDANGELGSRPRALMGVDTSSALKDARSRAEKSRASDRAASSSSAAAPAAAKPLSLSEQRRQERMDKGGFKGAPSAEQKKNAEAAKRADHVAHRQRPVRRGLS